MAIRPDYDGVMAPLIGPGGPGAAIALRQGGKLIHAAGYGLANVEWGVPIDADTVFRIGSITKQFTAAAILKLAEAGKLEIDDPIERHLPDYPVGARRITIRRLLNHTSGIKSYTSLPTFVTELMRKDLPLAGLIDVFKDLPPDFEPGEKFLYCNSGYVLLGAVIEAVSGKDYATFLKDTFFGPLNLASTCYLHDRTITPKRAAGYELAPELVNAKPLSMSLPHAAGALGSTVNDLLRWEAALRGGKAVSPESYTAMTTPGSLNDGSPTTYGLGLASGKYRGRPFVGHGGGINGFMTSLEHWPDDDLTVVMLCNVVPSAVEQATRGLVRRALDLPDTARTPITLDEACLEACAGVFRFDLGPLRLAVRDGGLTGAWPVPRSRFVPVAEDTFFLERDPEIGLKFEDSRDGSFQQLMIQGYGEPVVARRVAEPTEQPAE